MTTWFVSDPGALRAQLTTIRDIAWPWQAAAVEDLCRQMHWTLLEILDGKGAFADAGLGVPDDEVRMTFRDSRVEAVMFSVTETVRDAGPPRDHFLAAAFAGAVAEATTVFGPPTPGPVPEPLIGRWRLVESTVLIRQLKSAVTLTWASNWYQDEWDRVAEALA
ncbi:DUF6301 family protein [Actinoplanes awajinensis]|uniref:Uncharacterized protein n=1 Tax=Actinoplanes awajinensis subsp. mycoplanecinus TaxID=135947 RepID=A0A101JG13_9ACTN|nr:DUF6301 family protein [Actinoplanes awajinensis]KUL25806.1 hypothetical protein ADL15_39540 [Actinoplanes awajinensis subsp. mycoplanecinus]